MIAPLVLLLAAYNAPAQGQACPPETIEPERIHSGIYLDEFEGQAFHEGAQSLGDVDRRARPSISLTFDVVGLGERFGIKRREQQTAYRIRFVGVRRSRGQGGVPCGYGHMNAADAEVRLVTLLGIEALGSSVNSGSRR